MVGGRILAGDELAVHDHVALAGSGVLNRAACYLQRAGHIEGNLPLEDELLDRLLLGIGADGHAVACMLPALGELGLRVEVA